MNFTTKAGTVLPLLNLKGKNYLQVQDRIRWFREEKPGWGIETEFLVLSDNLTVAKATIKDETGRIICQATKREDIKGFQDHSEKAETGAIGRAVALCGYGTQFAVEFDEIPRIVDSPRTNPLTIGAGEIQPDINDGNHTPAGYRISFGQWRSRSIEEVVSEHGPQKVSSYMDYLENEANKKGKPLSDAASEFIAEASTYLAAMENQQ